MTWIRSLDRVETGMATFDLWLFYLLRLEGAVSPLLCATCFGCAVEDWCEVLASNRDRSHREPSGRTSERYETKKNIYNKAELRLITRQL